METQNHTTENTISIPREKFLSMISKFNIDKNSWNALNPQPIPPESIFISNLAFQAIDRLMIIQETADLMNKASGNKSPFLIKGHMKEFVTDICGNEAIRLLLKRYRNPYGDPVPRPNWDEKLSGQLLISVGAMIERLAKNNSNPELNQELISAGAKIIDTGISRL